MSLLNFSDWRYLPLLLAVLGLAGCSTTHYRASADRETYGVIEEKDETVAGMEEEFTLHLGPDPGLLVERTQLEDLTEESGFFSSRKTLQQSWRIRVKNNGAFTAARDGSVVVLIHEMLPRATDDRVTVEIEKASPDLATTERWKKEREEKGALTWSLRVPQGGERLIELATSIAYPEDMRLIFE